MYLNENTRKCRCVQSTGDWNEYSIEDPLATTLVGKDKSGCFLVRKVMHAVFYSGKDFVWQGA